MSDAIHPYLSRALYIFITVLVAVVCMVSASWIYMSEKEAHKDDAYRALKIWKNRVDTSRQSNSIIDQYETDYLDLVNHGVIGDEDRLSWYESIQRTSEERGMPSVKYSVSSQIKMNEREVGKYFKGLDLYRSIMTMDIKMSHEGDLFALLNNLDDSANGLYVVDQCDLERIDLKAASATALNNMKAYCEISWYTIRASKKRRG